MLTIRQTILGDYQTCPYKCYLGWGDVGQAGKYDLNESPKNKYNATGIAFHEVMEWAGREIINGKRPSLEECMDLMKEKFDKLNPELFDGQEDIDAWRIRMLEQVNWAYIHTLQSNLILDVEKTFTIPDLFKDMPPFTGTIDRIEGVLDSKDVVLMDYKTGRKYTKKKVKNSIQACIYSLAFFRKYGFLPKEFRFIFTHEKRTMSVQITHDFITNVSAEIMRIVNEMKAGHFEPNNSNKFFCKNFCEFYSECPKFKRSNKKGWDAVNE